MNPSDPVRPSGVESQPAHTTPWIVITGPPSSGKTTLLNLFATAGEQTSPDSTRQLIADVVASGRDAEEFRFADDFQPQVLDAMVAAEDKLDPAARVFLEYALPCNIAFHRTEDRELTPGLADAARRTRYQSVFILDPVGWEGDEQRVEDVEYQAAVHQHMFDVYHELGYNPIAVPPLTPSERREFVLEQMDSQNRGDDVVDLPEVARRFIQERQSLGGVSAVLIYGSYARGTAHAKSDIDIIFVVDEGFKSECVVIDGYCFEVLEATKKSMFDHWAKNFDEDRHWYLWKDAKVIYDRDGQGAEAVVHARSLVGDRHPWSTEMVKNRELVARQVLEKTKFLHQTDPGSAAMVLVEIVQGLTKTWFHVRGEFAPAPKALLAYFAEHAPEFGQLLEQFYAGSGDHDDKFATVDRLWELTYDLDSEDTGARPNSSGLGA